MKLPQTALLLKRLVLLFSSCLLLSAAPVLAQISQVDPNDAIGTDSGNPAVSNPPSLETGGLQDEIPTDPLPETNNSVDATTDTDIANTSDPQKTFQKDDLIGAAEGVFGKGAAGLGGIIENILRKQGEPNGYIVGREGGGAFVLGLRYGSGTLKHKVEGEQPVYWTGPSVGFDAGANAGSTFVLVYNLYDTEDLFRRYPSGEGAAYLVGGFNASYLRRGDVVLIPIRLGVGVRLGANVGYMKFSKKQRWLPF